MSSRRLDLRAPAWFRRVVFYELSVRSFRDSNGDGIGDLPGVVEKLDYLRELGIGAIWLLPFFRSPWRDDGYDISDHYSVDPRLGTLDDLSALVEGAHARGMRVIGDFVSNHVSDQHPWFQEARRDRNSPHRSWFLWSDTGKEFSRARTIFQGAESSNWTWDEAAGQYYFHRFFASQPDLNYDTPAVRAEMLNVARFWLGRGLDGFRCDAVPYLIKREGTACQSLPEVHQFFQEVRAMMDTEFPGTALVAEANQTVPETVAYFDQGREFPMVMHFPLMPNLFLALAESNPRRILDVLRTTLPIVPPDCGWAYFLRNHDELTLDPLSEEERALFLRAYQPAHGSEIYTGLRRRLAPLVGGDDASVLLLTALILALPGSPYLYYGDEIGMGDRLDLPDRDPVRTPMQWTAGPTGGFSSAAPEALTRPLVTDPEYAPAVRNVEDEDRLPFSLLGHMRMLLRVRGAHATLFGRERFTGIDLGDSPVLGFWRPGSEYEVLCLYNFSDRPAAGTVPLSPTVWASPVELLRGGSNSTLGEAEYRFRLGRRGFSWTLFPVRAP
ncbi:MAG TPA: alpha-amylase family protein [Thermoplasmata archaeon]|nr:alpha-amylase family protein [Thermoplasmata archaeon]